MKTRTAVWTLTLALVCATSALAHGGNTDIMGTVTSVSADQVIVNDREGKSVTVRVTKDTKYRKGDSPAAATDLKIGDRVAVEAAGKAGAYGAIEIRFSSSAPPSEHEGEHHQEGDHPHADHK